jgi:hypothetical protein
VLYSAALRFMAYRGSSWRRRQPFDWNLWSRMARAGVRMGFLDAVTYRYFPSEYTRNHYRTLVERVLNSKALP